MSPRRTPSFTTHRPLSTWSNIRLIVIIITLLHPLIQTNHQSTTDHPSPCHLPSSYRACSFFNLSPISSLFCRPHQATFQTLHPYLSYSHRRILVKMGVMRNPSAFSVGMGTVLRGCHDEIPMIRVQLRLVFPPLSHRTREQTCQYVPKNIPDWL